MSSTYYNNLWKEAINELLENIHEEFDPLDQNLNDGDKGVCPLLFSLNMREKTQNGLGFMHIFTSNMFTVTRYLKIATIRLFTHKKECC